MDTRASFRPSAWILCVAGLIVLSACGDDPTEVGVAPASGGDYRTESTEDGEQFRTDVTVESAVVASSPGEGSGVTFDARLVSQDGSEYVEVLITSEPPPGSSLWAILINGRVTTRTNQIPGAVVGVNVEPFASPNGPIQVSVRAESEAHEVIGTESDSVSLREE